MLFKPYQIFYYRIIHGSHFVNPFYIILGYEFDTGIHYIGQMHSNSSFSKFYLDQCSDGQIGWCPMNKAYDIVAFGEAKENRRYPIMADVNDYKKELLKHFPDEKDAIENYVKIVKVTII